MSRYVVTMTPDMRGFGILDRELYGYCTLVDENKNLLPLEWTTKAGAEAWLNMCFRRWKSWENGSTEGKGRAVPKGWRPRRPEPSPFDRGWQFYN